LGDREPEKSPAPPSLVDGREHNVDPRTVTVGRAIGLTVSAIVSVVPLAFITVGWALGGIPVVVYLPLLAVWLLLLGSALLIFYTWPAKRHRHLLYRVDERGLRIRRGVFWRKVTWIPITRVQHIDVSQGPLQRKLELATLTVHTAGTEGASISLAGLEHGVAGRLRDHLRPDRDSDAG
jgi:membrane protein YdbS with pleckstrin-like domain